MEVDKTIELIGRIVTVLHVTGIVPFKWNKTTQKVEKITKRREKLRRWFVFTFSAIIKISLVLHAIIHWPAAHLADVTEFLQYFLAGIMFISAIFDFHLIWKEDELRRIMNDVTGFYTTFNRNYVLIF